MKKLKKLNRKLTLNKKTITNLTPKRMHKAAGGYPTGFGSQCCIPCDTTEVPPTFVERTCQGHYSCPCPTVLEPTCLC
jgi:hypothetical protein